MLCSNDELVRVPWMLEIMHQTSGDHGQLVLTFEVLLDVTSLQHEMEALKGIEDVNHVMERVLFKVPL